MIAESDQCLALRTTADRADEARTIGFLVPAVPGGRNDLARPGRGRTSAGLAVCLADERHDCGQRQGEASPDAK